MGAENKNVTLKLINGVSHVDLLGIWLQALGGLVSPILQMRTSSKHGLAAVSSKYFWERSSDIVPFPSWALSTRLRKASAGGWYRRPFYNFPSGLCVNVHFLGLGTGRGGARSEGKRLQFQGALRGGRELDQREGWETH